MRKIALLLCLLLFSGCATREIAPVLEGLVIPTNELQKVSSHFSARQSLIINFKTLLRVKLRAGGEQNSFRYAVVYQRPGQLRVETYPTNGFYTLSLIGVTQNQLTALIPSEEIAYTATPTREVMEKVLGLPFTVDEIASIVVASPNVEGVPLAGVVEGDIYKVLTNDSRTYFEINRNDFSILVIKIFDSSRELIAEARYKNYQEVEGVTLPASVQLRFVKVDATAELVSQKFSRASSVSDSLFNVEIPAEFRLEIID